MGARVTTGLLGAVPSQRPLLTTIIIAIGAAALAVIAARQSDAAGFADRQISLILTAFAVACAPLIVSGAEPRIRAVTIALRLSFMGALLLLAAIGDGRIAGAPQIISTKMALAALAFYAFLIALSPLMGASVRLFAPAAMSAALAAAMAPALLAIGGAGDAALGGHIIGFAIAASLVIGQSVAIDFASGFARGAEPARAAGYGGRRATASFAYAFLAAIVFLVIATSNLNFGAIDWPIARAGVGVAALCALAALLVNAAALALADPNEQLAVDENRRSSQFAARWRPLRMKLPVTTAVATTAIIGVCLVVAIFEVGMSAPFETIAACAALSLAAAICFVSLRTSILIAAMLLASAVLADYLTAVIGMPAPQMPGRIMAITLLAVALSQLTVSWRDAGDDWRNARDVAENAMSDGARRYIIAVGSCTIALAPVAGAGLMSGAAEIAFRLLLTGIICLVLSPFLMIALSAGTRRY